MSAATTSFQQSDPLHRAHYRPDVDGLRAVAVLSVVGFHAFPAWISGGFVGVDIFFVISGFLISSIILGGLSKNKFSFVEFYSRRVRRIFPALLLMLIVTAAFGWLLLFADDYQQLGKHIAAGAGFVSNFALWRESGYFDAAAETKPLLHLWSLGIEEQFYILWPLLLWAAWKAKVNVLAVIASIAVATFAVSIWALGFDASAAFYSPQSRFWELSVGAILGYVTLFPPAKFKRIRLNHNALAFAGGVLLYLGIFAIDRTRAFPGWFALLPTMGAALVIAAGMAAWPNRVLFSNRALVWVGLISYPLYLWHWPLLVFLRVVGGAAPSVGQRVLAVTAAVVLAWATYQFVEKPIRVGHKKRLAVGLLAGGMALMGGIGFLFFAEAIKPNNSREAVLAISTAAKDWDYPQGLAPVPKVGYPFYYYTASANADITLLLGDSHVMHYKPRLVEAIRNGRPGANTVYFGLSGACTPIPALEDPRPECNDMRNKALALLADDRIKVVVIGAAWNGYLIKGRGEYYFVHDGVKLPYFEGEGRAIALGELEHFLVTLKKTKTVYLLLDNASDAVFDPKSYYAGTRLSGVHVQEDIPRYGPIAADERALNAELQALAKRANVRVLNPLEGLCGDKGCPLLDDKGEFTYMDNGHLRPRFVKENALFVDDSLHSN